MSIRRMKTNNSKCAVMTLGKITPLTYFINNIQLENVTYINI